MTGNSFYRFFNAFLGFMKDIFVWMDSYYPFDDVSISLFWLIIGGIGGLFIYQFINLTLNPDHTDDSERVSLLESDDDLDLDSDWEDYY